MKSALMSTSFDEDLRLFREVSAKSHLRVNLVDTDLLVKMNELQPITNPITFLKNNIPTPDGLLSNEIFGITMYDRMNTVAYIDLYEYFLTPLLYKTWSRLDTKITAIVNETKYFIVNDKGELVEDDGGETGLAFLKKNFKKFKFARNSSKKRDMNVDFIERMQQHPEEAFIRKMPVIPAGLRDVDTSKGGRVAIGEINELYRNLILGCKALKESTGYGLDMVGATRGRIQAYLVQLYDFFGGGTTINGNKTSPNIPGKMGILRSSVSGKTVDYASRQVISAPDLHVDRVEDFQSDLDHAAIPLASIISNFTPFIIFAVRRFFENAFSGEISMPIIVDPKSGEQVRIKPKDYQAQFSEERIKKEMDRFREGYSSRMSPVTLEGSDGKQYRLRFKGFNTTMKEYQSGVGNMPVVERDLTWCDVLFICAIEATQDKHVLICRYPIDSIFNQFPIKIHVSSTNKTEPMVVNGKFYSNYPYIRQDDIGSNTSNRFVDSVRLCNLFLKGMSGDYDGDTVTVKPVYTVEANLELDRAMSQPFYFVQMGSRPIRVPGNEAYQALYNLTLVLPDAKGLSTPVF